jgi:hypothetical protein
MVNRIMASKLSLIIVLLLLVSCTSKKQEPTITWLYGYGQVEKLSGHVKSLIEERSFGGKPIPYFIYTFNNKGDVIKIEDGFQSGITSYNTLYNNNGKKTEAIGLYGDSGKEIKEVYKYDDNEHLTECIGNANKLSQDTDRFIYDDLGNLIEHQQYFEKKPLWIFKYKYDKNAHSIGFVQSMTTRRDSFKTSAKDTSRYISFDSHNNWTKAIFLKETITRKITYY